MEGSLRLGSAGKGRVRLFQSRLRHLPHGKSLRGVCFISRSLPSPRSPPRTERGGGRGSFFLLPSCPPTNGIFTVKGQWLVLFFVFFGGQALCTGGFERRGRSGRGRCKTRPPQPRARWPWDSCFWRPLSPPTVDSSCKDRGKLPSSPPLPLQRAEMQSSLACRLRFAYLSRFSPGLALSPDLTRTSPPLLPQGLIVRQGSPSRLTGWNARDAQQTLVPQGLPY